MQSLLRAQSLVALAPKSRYGRQHQCSLLIADKSRAPDEASAAAAAAATSRGATTAVQKTVKQCCDCTAHSFCESNQESVKCSSSSSSSMPVLWIGDLMSDASGG